MAYYFYNDAGIPVTISQTEVSSTVTDCASNIISLQSVPCFFLAVIPILGWQCGLVSRGKRWGKKLNQILRIQSLSVAPKVKQTPLFKN